VQRKYSNDVTEVSNVGVVPDMPVNSVGKVLDTMQMASGDQLPCITFFNNTIQIVSNTEINE
jgi:hypothetical protein